MLSALQWIWILKRFFCDTWSRAWKTRSESRETNNPPYVENNYRIEVKITFMLIAYLVLLCEFFWEFSIFQFCRPLVDIYWHPLLMPIFKIWKKQFGSPSMIKWLILRQQSTQAKKSLEGTNNCLGSFTGCQASYIFL